MLAEKQEKICTDKNDDECISDMIENQNVFHRNVYSREKFYN